MRGAAPYHHHGTFYKFQYVNNRFCLPAILWVVGGFCVVKTRC